MNGEKEIVVDTSSMGEGSMSGGMDKLYYRNLECLKKLGFGTATNFDKLSDLEKKKFFKMAFDEMYEHFQEVWFEFRFNKPVEALEEYWSKTVKYIEEVAQKIKFRETLKEEPIDEDVCGNLAHVYAIMDVEGTPEVYDLILLKNMICELIVLYNNLFKGDDR